MAEQVITDGATLVTDNGSELVCTGVRYQEDGDGNRFNHEYIFRSRVELDEEQAAREKADREAEEAAKAAEESQTTDNTSEGVQ